MKLHGQILSRNKWLKKKMWNKITKHSIKKQQAKTKQDKYSVKKVILYLKLCCHSSYLAGFAYFLQNVPYQYIYNKCMIAGEMYADVCIHATFSEIKVIVWLRPVFGKMNAHFLLPVSYSPGTFFVAWFLDDRNFLPLPALTSACLQFPFHHSWFPWTGSKDLFVVSSLILSFIAVALAYAFHLYWVDVLRAF